MSSALVALSKAKPVPSSKLSLRRLGNIENEISSGMAERYVNFNSIANGLIASHTQSEGGREKQKARGDSTWMLVW